MISCREAARWLAFVALPATIIAAPVAAQNAPASQRGSVSQTIAGAEITLTYDRPVARGRELFGDLVRWGSPWTPGANISTRIELSEDLLVAGERLEAGKYSIWIIPEPDEWTIIFSDEWDVFHLPYPEGKDALRVKVVPVTGRHMETLVWYFPVVDGREGALAVHWGEKLVEIPITVP